MLLLAEKDKFEPIKNSRGEFYKTYKKEIDKKIAKVEKDFNFTQKDIVEYIEETVECDDYERQKIWFVFYEGFGALSWGLQYKNEMTPEELYSQYFDSDDLNKQYDIEQKALANNISITTLNDLLDKIIKNPREFYIKICDSLSVEERMFILRNLENKDCTTCLNGHCRVETSEKIGLDETGKPEGNSCIGWYNPELIGRCKVLKKTDIHKLK